jgi:hypothetical protein
MGEETYTPGSAAIKLTHWLDALELAGLPRFPVDVEQLALGVGQQLGWADPISVVHAAPIRSFEGGLFKLDEKRWALVYNETIKSAGRIRFTQAHELGHYLVHRRKRQTFECSQADIVHGESDDGQIEPEADMFAVNLLMPMKQFRAVTHGQTDFDVLSDASKMFGVSLTSVALRWIQTTQESAMLVLSRDGFVDWSVSTDKARSNGVFLRSKGRVVELPAKSLAADSNTATCRAGERVALSSWFEHAHVDAEATEMKLVCDNYGYTLSLLRLSPGDKVWAPREWGDR